MRDDGCGKIESFITSAFYYTSHALTHSFQSLPLPPPPVPPQVSVQYTGGRGAPASAPFGKDCVMDVLVTENLFYGRQVARVYDLKGSERDRYVAQLAQQQQHEARGGGGAGEVAAADGEPGCGGGA